MKAEERHEQRENDLSGWLQYGLWAFLRQNGSYILLAAALGFLGYQLWQRHKANLENERASAFIEFDNATSPENETYADKLEGSYKALLLLPDMVESSPVKEIQTQAALELARLYDEVASNPAALAQRSLSRSDALSKSFDMFTRALELQPADPLIAGKAHLGIAGVYEDKGDWDKARAEYQTMIDGPMFSGPLAQLAKDRLAAMDDRRNAPRLAAWSPPPIISSQPATSAAPGFGLPTGNLLGPGAAMPNPSTGPSPFMQGPFFNPATTNPFGGGFPSLGGSLDLTPPPTTPASTTPAAPALPESATQPK